MTAVPTQVTRERAIPRRPVRTLLIGLVTAIRPRQWLNVLVAAAPFAAGGLTSAGVIADTAVAFAAFCVTSSGVYLFNDAHDLERDRAHPTKRARPVAAGVVPRWLAYVLGLVLIVAGVGGGWLVGSVALGSTLGTYAVLQLGYCLYLKDQPVIDLVVIASGFQLRAIAGGVAAGLPISDYFLIVTSFGSLFVAAGKRYSEALLVGEGRRPPARRWPDTPRLTCVSSGVLRRR